MEPITLNKIFDKKKDGTKLKISVKVIKAINSTEFLVADSSGSCKIKITNLKPIYIANLQEKNFLRIFNVKINLVDKIVILDSTSSVYKTSKFDTINGLEGDAGKQKVDLKYHYNIPSNVISEFMRRASEKNVQTLAFLAGFKDGNTITVADIVFPKQNGTKSKINEIGKSIFQIFY